MFWFYQFQFIYILHRNFINFKYHFNIHLIIHYYLLHILYIHFCCITHWYNLLYICLDFISRGVSLITLLARAAKGWRGRESWRLLKLQKERETRRLRRFDLWEPRSILRLCEEGSVASRLKIAWNLHFLGRLQFLMQSNLFYVWIFFLEIYFFLFIKFSRNVIYTWYLFHKIYTINNLIKYI